MSEHKVNEGSHPIIHHPTQHEEREKVESKNETIKIILPPLESHQVNKAGDIGDIDYHHGLRNIVTTLLIGYTIFIPVSSIFLDLLRCPVFNPLTVWLRVDLILKR